MTVTLKIKVDVAGGDRGVEMAWSVGQEVKPSTGQVEDRLEDELAYEAMEQVMPTGSSTVAPGLSLTLG